MMVLYNFYPTSCVHFIPEPWRGDRKHTRSCIKIICNHKPYAWNILFITCFNTIFIFTSVHNLIKCPSVISIVLCYNPLWRHRSGMWKKISICRHRSGIWKCIPWVISTGYEENHVINHDSSQLQMYYVFQNNVAFVSFFFHDHVIFDNKCHYFHGLYIWREKRTCTNKLGIPELESSIKN